MSNNNAAFVALGKIGKPYGLKGWLTVISYTQPASNILSYQPWYLFEKDHWIPLKTKAIREFNQKIMVQVENIITPEEARLYTGKTIGILESQLPHLNENEYYWRDLEGLTVIDQHQQRLGTVHYLMETGSNDVLIIQGDKEFAIPYLIGDVIQQVDLQNRIIYVQWELL